jgi:hypothetical protein
MRPYNLNGGRPRKLTDDQVKYIKANLYIPLRQLAAQFGVNHVTIYNSLKYDPTNQTHHSPDNSGKESAG